MGEKLEREKRGTGKAKLRISTSRQIRVFGHVERAVMDGRPGGVSLMVTGE